MGQTAFASSIVGAPYAPTQKAGTACAMPADEQPFHPAADRQARA
jgi:hypothetical protein